MLTRRLFLRGSAVVMAGMGAAPSWLARAAEDAEGETQVLVAIFQRGAADGLNVVVPFAEKRYYELRPTIGIPAPRDAGPPNHSMAAVRDRPGRTLRAASPVAAAEGRFGTNSNWRSWRLPGRPIRRAPTSTRRTIWNRARPVSPAVTGG